MTLRFLRLLRLAFWRAFQHDAFSIAKACAYSSILTFFPLLLVVGAVLASFREGQVYMREFTYALGQHSAHWQRHGHRLPARIDAAPTGLLVTTSLLTLWTSSGVMVSWMDGFRRSYELPKTWGLVKERIIAFALVILAGIPLMFATILVASGSSIETHHPVSYEPRIRLLRSADVVGHSLAHRNPHQHRGDRADLSQRRAAHPALAQRASGFGAGHGHVVQRHRWLSAGICRITPTTASCMARWERPSPCWSGCTWFPWSSW